MPLLLGVCVNTWALGLFAPSIARQSLAGHARLTRIAVRSAFLWAIVGAALLAWLGVRSAVGDAPTYLDVSAARHAFGLGLVTVMIYGVGARALPSFTGRRLWSEHLQLATIVVANLAVALRVVPEVVADSTGAGLVALSGVLAYLGLVLFAVNIRQTLRAPAVPPAAPGSPVPIAVRLPPAPTVRAGGGGIATPRSRGRR